MIERNNFKKEAAFTGYRNIFNNYKEKRNLVTSKLKVAKLNYFKTKLKDKNASSKEMWNDINSIIGNVRSQFPSQILIGGKLLSKPIEMATAMNNFFITKIKNLKQDNMSEDIPTEELKAYLENKLKSVSTIACSR